MLNTRFGCIVLAGGASRRMGQDKATLQWGEQVLLQHLVEVFQPAFSPLVVVGAYHQQLPGLPENCSIVFDAMPFPGPLHGLSHALELVQGSEAVFVTGCDYPLVVPALAAYLAALMQDFDACIMEWNGVLQPLPGLYRPGLLPMLRRLMATGKRSLHALLEVSRVQIIPECTWREFDPQASMLLNINTPEEYQAVWARFTSLPPPALPPASLPTVPDA